MKQQSVPKKKKISIPENLKTNNKSLLKDEIGLKDYNHDAPPLILNYKDALSVDSSLTGGKGSHLEF